MSLYTAEQLKFGARAAFDAYLSSLKLTPVGRKAAWAAYKLAEAN